MRMYSGGQLTLADVQGGIRMVQRGPDCRLDGRPDELWLGHRQRPFAHAIDRAGGDGDLTVCSAVIWVRDGRTE